MTIDAGLSGFRIMRFEAAFPPKTVKLRDPDKRTEDERHPTPEGCHWARDCELCPWPDCVVPAIGKVIRYDDPGAEQLRNATRANVSARVEAIKLRRQGMSEEAVARRMGVTPRSVRYWCKDVGGIPRRQGNRTRALKARATAGQLQ